MVRIIAFEFFGSFRFTMQQCELDIDNFLSGGSNFPHKKSFIKLPLAAQQHLEGNGKMLKWTERGEIFLVVCRDIRRSVRSYVLAKF